ncbi:MULTISPECIES: urease accessory protein UreF [Cohnella]|uniref:urease accessory protein UreF n=1 Tax=Cohnella TaxID=329857 RepID=UPI0009BB20A7|nr:MULTISPECIES: urease accessory UreF family protein [Cohnella]MBN2983219.1 urease accessory protein UreF [Cohnella algarum]
MTAKTGGPVSQEPYNWLSLQLLLDSALPIGSFAHSYGLETLVQENVVRDGAELRQYLEGMLLHSWATGDLMVVKAVYADEAYSGGGRDPARAGAAAAQTGHAASVPGSVHSAHAGASAALPGGSRPSADDVAYAASIERLVHVQRLGAETRDGVEKTGRRLMRLAPHLFPSLPVERLAADVRAGRCLGTYPYVFGWLCRHLGIPLDRAAEGYLYACASTGVNAALRLMPMGQHEAQKLLASLFPVISEAWADVRDMDPADAYGAMPQAEIGMIRHERLYSRLFMS